MKKRKEIHPLLILLFCLIVVAVSSGLLALAEKNFKTKQIVSAEELPELSNNIKQNQLRDWLNDGYLTDATLF